MLGRMATRRASKAVLPVRRVQALPLPDDEAPDLGAWPFTMPPVRQVLREGLDLGAATVLVGENGAGKSTLVEAIAMAYGLNGEGGSTGTRLVTRRSESPLAEHLLVVRNPGAARWGYFLRAETMHSVYTYLEQNPGLRPEPRFHERSHGEGFLDLLANDRYQRGTGFFCFDEPESALSFESQLRALVILQGLVERGSQVLMATHSPVLAALPGATLLQVDGDGVHRTRWEDLAVVDHYRRFLERPESYLRHLR